MDVHEKFGFKGIIEITLSFGLILGISIPAKALYMSPHSYLIQRNYETNYGGYFYNPYGQANLNGGFDSDDAPDAFITNEMLIGFNSWGLIWMGL